MQLNKQQRHVILKALHYATEWEKSVMESYKGVLNNLEFKKAYDHSQANTDEFTRLRIEINKR